jgi:hypothetical protein
LFLFFVFFCIQDQAADGDVDAAAADALQGEGFPHGDFQFSVFKRAHPSMNDSDIPFVSFFFLVL